jgi:hypothetical protein
MKKVDSLDKSTADKISILLNDANNLLPQIAIPARKRLQAAIEAGEAVFIDPTLFGYPPGLQSNPKT